MAENGLFQVEIVCPDHLFYEGQASMIEFNTSEGQMGIYKNHIPETVILRPGIAVITTSKDKLRAAIHNGFAQILKDKVTILAQTAEWPDEIDLDRAMEAKKRAESRLENKNRDGVDVLRAEAALRRSLVRIDLTRK